MPHIIGAVDGTIIKIQRPMSERDKAFFSRKGPGLNCMGVCDFDGKFIAFNSRFPASCHDSFVLKYAQ